MDYHCKYDELIDSKELKSKFHPKNRNKHPDDQIDRLVKILKYQGWRYAVKISKRSDKITSGHGRVLAAEKLKCKVPVVYQEYESDEQEYADVQADNAIASWAELDLSGVNSDIGELGPDFDIDLLGIKDFEIEPADKYEGDEDAVPKEPEESKTKKGDLYELGNHRLLCGDATDSSHVGLLLRDEKVDAAVSDPPYGIGFKYESHNDCRDKWFGLMDLVIPMMRKIARFVVIPCCGIDRLDWWYKNHKPDWLMCWYKGSPGHRSHVGFNDWEAHLVWGKPPKQMHDFWQTHCGFDVKGHPCPKPVVYAEWLVERAAEKMGSIFDPFGGSGSTLIACEKTQRKCFMMEIEPKYCDVIVSRWVKFTGINEIKRNGEPVVWQDQD